MTTLEKAINAPKNENILRSYSVLLEKIYSTYNFYEYALFLSVATGV